MKARTTEKERGKMPHRCDERRNHLEKNEKVLS